MRHRPSVFFVPLWILLFAVASAKTSAAEYRVTRSFNVAAEPACMPALTKAPNGDLLVAFSTEWEPFPAGGVLKLIVSKDHGKTWSKPRILWKAKDPRVTIQVSNGMQTLSNGEILLPVSYCIIGKRKNVDPNEKRPFHIYDIKEDHPDHRREVRLLRSKDSGRSWTIENPKLENPWARFGRLLEARDGRLIMCGYGWYVESRDFGKTWGNKTWLAKNAKKRFFNETNLVEAADETLFSMVRAGGNRSRRVFGTNFSRDGGKTWSEPRSARVQGKMPDLLVLPSGRILMVVGGEGLSDGSQLAKTPSRRSFCTLFISDDHGRTWKRDLALAAVDGKTSVVPGDGPLMCRLEGKRILVIMQGMDRSKANDPLFGYHAGMSLIGNIIEPAAR